MGKLDVRAMAEELRHKIRESGFALLGVDSILMGFNLVAERPRSDGDPPKLEAMARRWSSGSMRMNMPWRIQEVVAQLSESVSLALLTIYANASQFTRVVSSIGQYAGHSRGILLPPSWTARRLSGRRAT